MCCVQGAREARKARGARGARGGGAARRSLARAELESAGELARAGKIRAVRSAEAAELAAKSGYVHLDIRPDYERERGYVAGSVHVPLFVEDLSEDPISLMKKAVTFGYGGWWMGNRLTRRNPAFLEAVETEVLPRIADEDGGDAPGVIVACGEGLRSLLAAEVLYNDGRFGEVCWIPQGYQSDVSDALESATDTPMQDAGSGAVSGFVTKLLKQK
eukprot:PRCOL_00002422-RA